MRTNGRILDQFSMGIHREEGGHTAKKVDTQRRRWTHSEEEVDPQHNENGPTAQQKWAHSSQISVALLETEAQTNGEVNRNISFLIHS